MKLLLKLFGCEPFSQELPPPRIPVIGRSETAGDIMLIQRAARVKLPKDKSKINLKK